MDKADWRRVAEAALERFDTPFYLFAYPPIEQRFVLVEDALQAASVRVPVQQFLSVKTLPVPHVVQEWNKRGRGVEVVSAVELSMALRAGVPANRIIVNGPGKHHWLATCAESGLIVNFDSLAEVRTLLTKALELEWTIGLRFAVSTQIDPDYPDQPAQFGMSGDDIRTAVAYIHAKRGEIQVVQFHLRSNIADVTELQTAVDECHEAIRSLALSPSFVDLGGGVPDFDVRQRDREAYRWDFLSQYARLIASVAERFESIRGIWLENGRYLLGPAGALVLSVLDTKWIGGRRFIICDGGRTNHALESDWEEHEVLPITEVGGKVVPTTICGPTCMAYDWIFRGDFPELISESNQVMYLNAGAYHLPWETRFSRGLARVLWSVDGQAVHEIRHAEETETLLETWQP